MRLELEFSFKIPDDEYFFEPLKIGVYSIVFKDDINIYCASEGLNKRLEYTLNEDLTANVKVALEDFKTSKNNLNWREDNIYYKDIEDGASLIIHDKKVKFDELYFDVRSAGVGEICYELIKIHRLVIIDKDNKEYNYV